ncbi:diguanylate cyclase domain-containing protein [Pseudoduganella danionis]|uniref:diguanylate cyclase domain-containing protein n=1 Tax=Pseudoduganella danionis TaxID=1890295 RepID=UPI003609C7C3
MQKVADLMLDAIFLVQEHGQIVFVNQAASNILGYDAEELVGRNLREFIYSKDLGSTEAAMEKVLQGQRSRNFENRYVRKDGTIAYLQWSAYWMAEEQIRIGVARDVTERVQLSRTYESMAELATAAHQSSTLEMLCTSFYAILQRRAFCCGLAIACDGERWSTVSSGNVAPRAAAPVHYPLEQAGIKVGELQVHLGHQHSNDEEIFRFAAMQASAAIQRITLQADLLEAAQCDELTGLPNRRLFQDRVQSAILRAQRDSTGGALLFIDLNNFKAINDEHGHDVGDILLKTIAARISQCVRSVDTVARIGGDEFVAVLESVTSPEQAEVVIDKIRRCVAQPVLLKDICLYPSASIGLSLYLQHGDSIRELMRHADKQMYADKMRQKSAPADLPS